MSGSDESGVVVGADGKARCYWCVGAEELQHYHDSEWGVVVKDDRGLFELLSLEGFQAGLSWLTILRKRTAFQNAFQNFDIRKVANFTEDDVERLVVDKGIVRSRGKIQAIINNANLALGMIEEFGSLANYIEAYRPDPSQRPKRIDKKTLQAMTTSPEAIEMSRDLKKRGWKYVGPSTVYAFMQAVGLVNDHCDGCFARERADS